MVYQEAEDVAAELQETEDDIAMVRKSKKSSSKEKESISTKKKRQKAGLKIATELAVEIINCQGGVNEHTIDAVLASLICGKGTIPRSTQGKKALKKATTNDRAFVEIAMIAAETTMELGGSTSAMKNSCSSVLTCRGLKQYKNFEFERAHIIAIAEAAAQDAILKDDLDEEDRNEIDPFLQRGRDSFTSKETIDFNIKDDATTADEQSECSGISGTQTLESVDHLRAEGFKGWRENVKDYIAYGIAEILGGCGNCLKRAADGTTRNIEDRVVNDYMFTHGIESYKIEGYFLEWDSWVSPDVDYVESEANITKYYYTVSTKNGNCTLEWPTNKKFLKKALNLPKKDGKGVNQVPLK